MGYKIAKNRILLLDDCRRRKMVKRQIDADWASRNLDEETLTFEAFSGQYPSVKDGLAVVLRNDSRLIMASYGLPPLAAILLRSDGTHLIPIARSIDDTILTLCRAE
jgi:hypothetical protein